jgi:2-dehydro-3-deoxyphosphooctonate aldolase (KDO 8-P synthase)
MSEKAREIKIAGLRIANHLPLVLIAGPCVIEGEKETMAIAARLKAIAGRLRLPLLFKASYDKANRSSIHSYRGPGLEEGLRILKEVKRRYRLPVLTDVHTTEEATVAARVVDVLQVPAFLCRQTDLIVACAQTGLPVNVKKGQFIAPEDMVNIVKKIENNRNRQILLTERGTSFGYHDLVVDMRALPIMKNTGYPVIFDATHSVQQPGGLGSATGGQREFIAPLAKAATALGIAALFVEVHPSPKKALSDGPNSLSLAELPVFLKEVCRIDRLVKTTSWR